MEGQRKVPKELIHFGKREYREKKPTEVQILRIKDKTVFKRGLLPSLVTVTIDFILSTMSKTKAN